jgi:hypothetical protein
MAHKLVNETNYSGRALRRTITLGAVVAKQHALLAPSGYMVRFRARPRARSLRIFAEGRTIVITVPKLTLTMRQAEGAVAYGMVKCANPDTSQASLHRVYHDATIVSYEEVPQKKKRKRGKPTLDRKFDALQKSAAKNEDRIKELERQLKRSKTLLKQKKQKLARMKRAFEGELASTAELSDNQLAVRLRLARDAS